MIQKSKVGHDSSKPRNLEQLFPQDVTGCMLAKNKRPTKRREEDSDKPPFCNTIKSKTKLLRVEIHRALVAHKTKYLTSDPMVVSSNPVTNLSFQTSIGHCGTI